MQRNGCQCNAVTTSDHCLVSIGDHCHALPSCPTPAPESCDPTPAPEPFTPVPVEYIHGGPKHPNVLYKSFKYTFLRTLKHYTLWSCRKPNCPKHFHQMLTIFIFSNGFYIPICHFLLINKLFSSYKACLQILTDECGKLGLNLDISNVMLDFEAGLIKAFKHALPSANIQGCRFHLGQSWWKHVGQLGLAKTYKDASTRDGRWLRRCFSLKMLPADMVEAVFEHSVRLGRLDKAIPFVEYLRKYY